MKCSALSPSPVGTRLRASAAMRSTRSVLRCSAVADIDSPTTVYHTSDRLSVAGKFSTMSMADLIQWGRTAQRTGLLKLNGEEGKEIRVVFRDGRIVFSSTNDKSERFPSYLAFLGLCRTEDADAAYRIQEATGESMA